MGYFSPLLSPSHLNHISRNHHWTKFLEILYEDKTTLSEVYGTFEKRHFKGK